MHLYMKLKSLANKHKGQMAFVIGAGPSLHFSNIEPLKDYVVLSVNSSIVKVPDCDYYLTDDEGVADFSYFYEPLSKSRCIKLFYDFKMKRCDVSHIDQKQIVWFKHKTWFDGVKYYEDGLVMTKNPRKPIIGARTSVGSAIHFAYIMGCDPIVLLGIDCCFREGKKYFWEFPGEPPVSRVKGLPLRALPVKLLNGDKADHHSVQIKKYFEQLAVQTKKQEINIINSSGGILDCFERMPLEKVLEKYVARKKK